jgi:hypothetical protein
MENIEYQQGKKILFLGQHHKECSILEAKLGNWTESSLSFKIGYSRDYVVEIDAKGQISYHLNDGRNQPSQGDVFVSTNHTLKIGNSIKESKTFETPKITPTDSGEIQDAIIEGIYSTLERGFEEIIEFEIIQEEDDTFPYDSKMKNDSQVLMDSKTHALNSIESRKKELIELIDELLANVDIPVLGFIITTTPNFNENSCLQYQIEITISFKDAPKPIDEKPLVYIKDAEFIGDTLTGTIVKGHPKLSDGSGVYTSRVSNAWESDQGTHIETQNSVYVVTRDAWNNYRKPTLKIKQLESGERPAEIRNKHNHIFVDIPYLPAKNNSMDYFWSKLIATLGESTSYKLLDPSEQQWTNKIGWIINPEDDLSNFPTGFKDYLEAEFAWP